MAAHPGNSNGGRVVAVSAGSRKGIKKTPVSSAILVQEHGMRDDAHAGPGPRQVSILASESIGKMRAKGLDVGPGDFAENITVEGFNLLEAKIGDRILVGKDVVLEISQIGKECHTRCAIYFQAGDCVMPREGVFARVVRGGKIASGDAVRMENP